jgi:hypothetical protein
LSRPRSNRGSPASRLGGGLWSDWDEIGTFWALTENGV